MTCVIDFNGYTVDFNVQDSQVMSLDVKSSRLSCDP